MPILYTCILNRSNDVVLEGFYLKSKVSYKQDVIKLRASFKYMGMETIVLNEDEHLSLLYHDLDNLVLVCVAQDVMA